MNKQETVLTAGAIKGPNLMMTEHSLKTWDRTTLYYRAWHPGSPGQRALILLHDSHEHSGHYRDLAKQLKLPELSIFAWDARGHGRSTGDRGYARDFHDLVRDADGFIRTVSVTHDIAMENVVVLGQGMGGLILSTWLHDFAQPVRAAVLVSPAFHPRLRVPFGRTAVRILRWLEPDGYLNTHLPARRLTHDRQAIEQRLQDPLVCRRLGVRLLASLFDTAKRVTRGAGAVTLPVLILSAGADRAVRLGAQRRFFRRLGSPDKHMEVFPALFHAMFQEHDRHIPLLRTRQFILEVFSRAPCGALGEAAGSSPRKGGALPPRPAAWSPRRLYDGVVRLALNTVGRMSAGIRLGLEAGFHSPQSLGYVCRNSPQGWTSLGRWLDRMYLNRPVCRGLRRRRLNLQGLLVTAIDGLRRQGVPVHILHLGDGPAVYLMEVLERSPDPKVTATCQDTDEAAIRQAMQMVQAKGLSVLGFDKGDAFEPESFARLSRKPNVVVAAGLYESCADSRLILHSLRSIHRAMDDKGYLIYTNQPYQPGLELLGRAFTTGKGRPWETCPRPQCEINRLVRAAGFQTLDMASDEQGMFTVTVATKRRRVGVEPQTTPTMSDPASPAGPKPDAPGQLPTNVLRLFSPSPVVRTLN
jgi:alpha-beta hydrolase superfamily lysophospholipase